MTRYATPPEAVFVGIKELEQLATPEYGPEDVYAAKQLFEKLKAGLSEREVRILEGLAAGVSSEDLAEEEGMSKKRMRNIIGELRAKLRDKV